MKRKILPVILILSFFINAFGSAPNVSAKTARPLPETSAAVDDWHRPAEFVVSQTVANEAPGAFTATMGEGPINSLISGSGFEPMVFRQRFDVPADSPNQLLLSITDATSWDTYREGFYDGAAVRVYRIINGQMTLVRTDTVPAGGHRASGWTSQIDGALFSPASAALNYSFDGWERRDVPYYFALRAVDTNGNESPVSNWVSAVNDDLTGTESNVTVPFAPPAEPTETDAPPAPANFAVSVDTAAGLLRFTWDAVSAADLAGYRLYRSDVVPTAHRGYGIDLATTPADPALYLRTGDMVLLDQVRTSWSRTQLVTNRVWDHFPASGEPTLTPFQNDEVPGGSWEFVAHPQPIPAAFSDHGETCLKIQIPDDGQEYSVFQYNHAGTWQDWYAILIPGQTYVAEVWMRQDGMTDPTVTFELRSFYSATIPPVDFSVDGTWHKYTTTFTPQDLWEEEGSIGTMGLYFSGPGTLYLDNFRVYAAGTGFMEFPQVEYDALAESGMQALRTHGIIKTGWGYTLEGLTNPPGVTGMIGNNTPLVHNLPSLLNIIDRAGINPWLQVEMFFSPEEWLGLVEFLAAPYDPAVDTPEAKPWAYRRYMEGQTQPWVNEFDVLYFELSNETWNPMFSPWTFSETEMPDQTTGRVYQGGEVYGLYQEYVRSIMRSSPYWTDEIDQKFEWVIGGWAAQAGADGYGQSAAATSPSSGLMTIAAYNGGWDEGEAPAEVNDEGFFKVLTYAPQAGIPSALDFVETQTQQQAEGITYALGTYEAGPGYSLPNTISAAQEESESQVMKSLAAGTGTLDIYLAQAYYGFDIQNFFTFSRGRYFWTSHARETSGGQAYPSLKALSLYNHEGLGDFLVTKTVSTPTRDLTPTTVRPALADAPMVSAYVTRDGDRYNLFVLSRKLDDYPVAGDDGYTPVTVHLPFSDVSAIKLYKMTGDPRANNLDADTVQVVEEEVSAAAFDQDFVLNASTGADQRGLPPGSVYLYVFEGAQTDPLPAAPQPGIYQAYDQQDPSNEPVFKFSVFFSEPVTGFEAADVILGGTAGANHVSVEAVAGSQDMEYSLSVSGMQRGGTVTVRIPAGATQAVDDQTASLASTAYDNTVTYALPEGGAQMIFPVLEDAGIEAENPNTNYEGAETQWLHGLGYDDFCGIYLKFAPANFEAFPVTSATLRVHVISGAPSNAHLFTTSDNWNADQLTFNRAPQPNQDLGSLPTQFDISAWLEFDITALVREEIQRDGVVSLVLTADNYSSWDMSESDEYAPQLVVHYGAQSRSSLAILTGSPWQVFHQGETSTARLESAGQSGTVIWSLADPSGHPLPPGLTLKTDGSFSGAPASVGNWTVAIRAQDDSQTVEKQIAFIVAEYGSTGKQIVLGGTYASPYNPFPGLVWHVGGAPQDAGVSSENPVDPDNDADIFISSWGNSGYVKYDLRSIPGRVLAAKLVLRQNYQNAPGSLSVYETGDTYAGTNTPWTESGLTFANAPAAGILQDSVQMTESAEWITWDVTAAAQNAGSGDRILSLTLSSNDYIGWLDTHESVHGQRPFLIVVYQPEPRAYLPVIVR